MSATTPAEELAKARISHFERETRALGNDASAAYLFHEIGLLCEESLHNPRSAATAFQNAYKLDPLLLANIRDARRLFSDVGNWQMVLHLLDAESNATPDERLKASLLFEKAAILEEKLSRHPEAGVAYQRALALQPKDISLLVQLASVFSAREDFGSLVEVYRSLAGVLEDPTLRAHYLTLAGLVLEERLKNPDQASRCFGEAFALDRRDLVLLAAVKRSAQREGRFEDLVHALAAEAELLGAEAAPAYLQLSRLYERMGRQEDALTALLAARRSHPTDPLILSALAESYEALRRHEELADVLSSWIKAVGGETESVALNLRLGELFEESLKRDDDAVACFKAILSQVAGHAQALAALGKLYYRRQDWEGSLWVLDAEIAASEDPKQKAVKLYKSAEILVSRLHRDEEGISRYSQCLQVIPGYLPAQKALNQLFERQHRYGELAALHEQDLLQTDDREHLIATLNRIASIYEDRLSDLGNALAAYQRILQLSPHHLPTLENLARLYEQRREWAELIGVLDLQASLVGDTKQVLSLHHRSAEIYEERLNDRTGAITAYERVLALTPSYLPALRALGRLYAQAGRWTQLIQMYRAEAEVSAFPAQAAALIAKVGELHEQRLKNDDDAVAAYQEVLTLEPAHVPALRALGRIYRAQGAWENLVEVLRAESAGRADPKERANALFQASAIWEDHLRRADVATQGYQDVLRLNPDHAPALRALERLYTMEGNTQELLAILEREVLAAPSVRAKVVASLKLARIYLDHQVDMSRAAQCCEQALALEPGNLLGLTTLERVRATDRSRRAELKVRFSEQVSDPRLKNALRLSAALDQDTTTSESRNTELRRALAEDPSDARLGFALERSLRQDGDFGGLAQLFEARLSTALPSEARHEATLRLADLFELKLDKPELAAGHYRALLERAPTFLPALQGLQRVCLKLGDFAGARKTLEAEGQASRDIRGAVEAFSRAGSIALEQEKDLDAAALNYRRALERDPLDAAANAQLEVILAGRGGASEIAELLERRAQAKLDARDTIAAADGYFAAAQSWLSSGGNPERAGLALGRALHAEPNHLDALELKGELALKNGNSADAASAFAARIEQGGEAGALKELHLKLGRLYQDSLQDPSRASAHLQTALASDPENVEALERLATLHVHSGNWTGALDSLRRLLEVPQPPEALARHNVALGRIYDEGFGDPTQASALYRKGLELAPTEPGIFQLLVGAFERAGNQPELVKLLDAQAGRVTDPGVEVGLRVKAAELRLSALGDVKGAIAGYQRVLALQPDSVTAHAALAELFTRDPTQSAAAVEEHRTVLRLDLARAESLHSLFGIWKVQKPTDRAFCAAAVAVGLEVANADEASFYKETRAKLGADSRGPIPPAELALLTHPDASNPWATILRVVGDQLQKIYPPQWEAAGVDRKRDRLKPDHPVHKALRTVADLLGVEDFEVYQADRGLFHVEMGDPLAVCVGPDLVRKFNLRELRFLMGQAMMSVKNKTVLARRLPFAEFFALMGNCVSLHELSFNSVGERNEAALKQLRKVLSRKALKALESPAKALAHQATDLASTVAGLEASAHRAGLLFAGDPSVGLAMLKREGPQAAALRTLVQFSLSDDFFKLRQRVGPSLSGSMSG